MNCLIKAFLTAWLFVPTILFGQEVDYEKFTSLKDALKTPNEVEYLALRRDRLKCWPDEIASFPNLKVLDLSHNKIAQIPDDLSSLGQLEELYLVRNKLDSLPNSIGQLKQLRILDVGNNEIYHVTSEIGELQLLEELALWSNNIYYLPKTASELKKLEKLDLRGIQISDEHQEAIKALFDESVKIKMSISCDCN